MRGYIPRPTGGFGVADIPNPNEGMATFQRGQGQTAPAGQGMNPFVTPTGESALSANLGLMQRGLANRRTQDFARSTDMGHPFGMFNSINTVAPDPAWEGLKQALYERGADKLTSTSAGSGPSFFAAQNPHALEQLQRLQYLKDTDTQAGLKDPGLQNPHQRVYGK